MDDNYRIVTLYEFKDKINPIRCSFQTLFAGKKAECGAFEPVALTKALPVGSSVQAVGEEVLEALKDFNAVAPEYSSMEHGKTYRAIAKSVGARSYKFLEENSRYIQVLQKFAENDGVTEVIPFDNCNIKQWISALENEIIVLPLHPSTQSLGNAIYKAFSVATYHPARTLPK